VLSRVDLRGRPLTSLDRKGLAGLLPRAQLDVAAALEVIRPVCADVRQRGSEAVRAYTAKFDGIDLASVKRQKRYRRPAPA